MSAAFSFIYSILKAIPILDSWIRDFLAYYQTQKINAELDRCTKALDKLKKAETEKEMRDAINDIAHNMP